MERSDLSTEQYNHLVEAIFSYVVEKGPSRMSMDSLASRLGMSKRTLYEIFESKDRMLAEVFDYHHHKQVDMMRRIFTDSHNALEGLANVIAYQQEFFRKTNSAFFRDMDERFKHLRPHYDIRDAHISEEISGIIESGIRQGVIRENCDFRLQLTLFRVQMESLKRMEEYFPPHITLYEAYQAIAQGFLRNIATTKGIDILEKLESNTRQIPKDTEEVSAVETKEKSNPLK